MQTIMLAPVRAAAHVRYGKNFSSGYEAAKLDFKMDMGIVNSPDNDKIAKGRRGKILMDPYAGWMAAVVKNQLFVVGFDLLEKDDIHPNQGQVEFYFDQTPSNMAGSFIEMETHAAFKNLNTGGDMQAVQYWTVRPYAEKYLSKNLMDNIQASLAQIEECKRSSR